MCMCMSDVRVPVAERAATTHRACRPDAMACAQLEIQLTIHHGPPEREMQLEREQARRTELEKVMPTTSMP